MTSALNVQKEESSGTSPILAVPASLLGWWISRRVPVPMASSAGPLVEPFLMASGSTEFPRVALCLGAFIPNGVSAENGLLICSSINYKWKGASVVPLLVRYLKELKERLKQIFTHPCS